MTITANMHNVSDMFADRFTRPGSRTSWLEIRDLRGNRATIFMDHDMASEIADLWKHMNPEPEPPTFDEALGAKCDAEARMDEARAIKGMA